MRRPEPASIPQEPGSYQFKDADGRVIYVGKAKNLRSRVMSYFGTGLLERTRQMVDSAATVEWIAVRNEVEALFLEYNLIKRHRPRFNIRLKDDKSYPYLAVTVDEEWPRAMVMRGAKRKGVRYFGPYAHAYAIRETLDLLLRTFPIRTCSQHKFDRHHRLGRPCLDFHIEKCAAPCVGAVSAEEYAGLVGELLDFLAGDTSPILDRLDKQMHGASDALEFERAARLRDQIVMVRKAIERQQMVDAREEDYDAIGIVDDELEASVQVFLVRKGRVVGRKGLVVDKVEDVTRAELVGRLLEQLYGDGGPAGASEVPREILVPEEPEDRPLYEEFLGAVRESNGRSAQAGPQGGTKVGTKASGKVGTKVRVRVPQRGAKRALLETVTQNAAEAFTRHKLRRATDHNARARALVALQDALGLPEAPLRIECYDISNLQGTEIVASMVVMEDGLPKRSDYRRFRLRHQEGQDDFASMEEVLTRRFRRYLAERTGRTDPTEGDDRTEGGEDVEPGTTGTTAVKKFAYPPNLVLIDGGKGQLGVAARVLAELGLDGIAVAGLAKRFEEVYVPGESEPVRIGRDSEALYLLQQIRDEAHRFAITYHRQLRGRSMTRSVLDDVPGLGPVRRARLLKEHGSVKRLRALTEEELVAIPWLPEAVGRAVFAHLHGLAAPASTPAGPGA